MTPLIYAPGQRWISNTESELGLGIIVEYKHKRITLSFPAAGERRTYAENNAPISRVQYQAGEQIKDNDDNIITITDVLEHNNCLIYSGTDSEGQTIVLPEIELNSFIHFNTAKERLLAGQIDKLRRYRLRQRALHYHQAHQHSPVKGLIGPRVQLLPHQFYIAHEVASRFAPRVLLADEVGLGKTIEAGLILHQQWVSGRCERALIIVPDTLIHQWLVEMLRRFNLHFTILDQKRCKALESSGESNPFESAQLILCSLSLLTTADERLQQALNCSWDLVIVDEAHHLTSFDTDSPEALSENTDAPYHKIAKLAEKTKGLLLLTATPEQLGIASHFDRLRLLDPHRYYDFNKFQQEQSHYAEISQLIEVLTADEPLTELQSSSAHLETLQTYLNPADFEALQSCLENTEDDDSTHQIIDKTCQLLLDRHGTGRVLFRNTRAGVEGFPDRQLVTYPLDAPDLYQQTAENASLEDRLFPERLLGADWLIADPRVTWLKEWLKQHRSEKVLLICADASTAVELEDHLRIKTGCRSASFYEGLSLLERDRAAAYFADEFDGAQLLVCSEIGSEGRNFQFAHHLILFDLPLNPDLLEQRIGRLDRIGQRHDVIVHCPYYTQSAQEILLRWYSEGVNSFAKPCPAGVQILNHVKSSLYELLEATPDLAVTAKDGFKNALTEKLDALITTTRQYAEEVSSLLHAGRDRLMELNSCQPAKADAIIDELISAEKRHELTDFLEKVLEEYGVVHEHHSEDAVILRPGDHMQCHHFPGLPEDGLTATFNRTLALSREDIHFLTWEHPLVSGALDMVIHESFGNTALCTIKLPPLKPGTLLLEAIYTCQSTAPKQLQLQRFMPLETLRVVIDSSHNNLSHIISLDHLNKLGEKVPKRMAQDIIRHARQNIISLSDKADDIARQHQDRFINDAIEMMESQQTSELQRLNALSAVNTNIREEEIEHIRHTTEKMKEYLKNTHIQVDSLRVVVAT